MADFRKRMRDAKQDAENAANEWKGRAKQKKKDMEDDTA